MFHLVKQVFKIKRDYSGVKSQLYEQSVRTFETRMNPFYAVLLFAFTAGVWIVAIFAPHAFKSLYETYGFPPFVAILMVPYFALYLSSKVIFKPSAEELSDDTSIFALYSACERKEGRALISAGLALLHAFLFVLCLLSWLAE